MSELTLEILRKAIELINQTKEEIVGFVISPADYHSIKEGKSVLYGVDDIKMFISPPYTGIELYVSTLVDDGKPIPLIKKMESPNIRLYNRPSMEIKEKLIKARKQLQEQKEKQYQMKPKDKQSLISLGGRIKGLQQAIDIAIELKEESIC